MANFFKSLFGSNRKPENQINTSEAETLQVPDAQLFVESFPPEKEENPNSGISRVKAFLNEDHYSAGRSEGYENHSQEDLLLNLKELKSIFILKANAVQEYLEEDLMHKRKRLIDLGEMMPNMKAQMDLDIEHIEAKIEELNFQKMMSVEGEGWIGPVLYAFEKGFRKGMMDYLNVSSFTPNGML